MASIVSTISVAPLFEMVARRDRLDICTVLVSLVDRLDLLLIVSLVISVVGLVGIVVSDLCRFRCIVVVFWLSSTGLVRMMGELLVLRIVVHLWAKLVEWTWMMMLRAEFVGGVRDIEFGSSNRVGVRRL